MCEATGHSTDREDGSAGHRESSGLSRYVIRDLISDPAPDALANSTINLNEVPFLVSGGGGGGGGCHAPLCLVTKAQVNYSTLIAGLGLVSSPGLVSRDLTTPSWISLKEGAETESQLQGTRLALALSLLNKSRVV